SPDRRGYRRGAVADARHEHRAAARQSPDRPHGRPSRRGLHSDQWGQDSLRAGLFRPEGIFRAAWLEGHPRACLHRRGLLWLLCLCAAGKIHTAGPILREIAQMPGFISFVGAIVGRRMYTITAWENAETPRQVLHSGAHKEAMGRFFNQDLGIAAHTSIWIPHTMNALWVRCTRCGKQVEYEKSQGVCACGEALPPPPPYW